MRKVGSIAAVAAVGLAACFVLTRGPKVRTPRSQQKPAAVLQDGVQASAGGGETFTPRPLVRAAGFVWTKTSQALPNPVSVAPWHEGQALVCNYSQLFLVNLASGQVREVKPPPEVLKWCPTGLVTRPQDNLVFVANYLGKDVWIFRLEGTTLRGERRIQDEEMTSPENLAVSADGTLVAAADYDSNRLLLFETTGRKVWTRPVGQAHGVDFGPGCVLASGLKERTLVLVDRTGRDLDRTGSLGWSPGKYLWPTSVRRRGTGWIVSDAHTGMVSLLDEQLRVREQVGGNGPSAALFNMPYAAEPWGDDVLVCDTYHHRLVKLNAKLECTQVIGADPADSWEAGEAKTSRKEDYWDFSNPLMLELPGLQPCRWHSGYGEFVAESAQGLTTVVYPKLGGLFNQAGFPYFCWTGRLSGEKKNYLVLGSYLPTLLVVDDQGRCVNVSTGSQRLWLVRDRLVDSFGRPVATKPLVDKAEEQFARHDQQLKMTSNALEAARQGLWPQVAPAEFSKQLEGSFTSPEGQEFWRRWAQGATAREKRVAAGQYLEEAGRAPLLYLEEYFLVRLLVGSF